MHARLFNKPHLGVGATCTLALSGVLPGYGSSTAYTGTLQASGGNGSARIVTWNGNLPPGADVSFDQDNQQVVVSWPAFSAGSIDVDNRNFEAGDTGWDKGPGWTIMQGVTAPDPNDAGSAWQAQYADNGGSSEILSHKAIPAVHGKTYNASVDVQQGATSANNAGAAVRLAFFDASGKRISGVPDGSVVKSGSNSEWHTSTIDIECPSNASTVRLGAVAFRKRQNAPLWVDNFTWNGAFQVAAVGTNGSADIPFSVTIADEDNCRATWSGIIKGTAADIIANLTFESGDFTDSTGRVWQVDSGTITTQFGSQPEPVTEPSVVANPAGSGLVMSKCPDTANVDGTFDYEGNENLGIVSALGAAAFGTDTDFCIELDVRLNAHLNTGLGSVSFLCITASTNRCTFGARPNTVTEAENTVLPASLTRTVWSPPTLTPGDWFHFAVTRAGDTLSCWYNGAKYAEYTGASALDFKASDEITVGNGEGSIASTMGWPGQFDNILITRGWAKYVP